MTYCVLNGRMQKWVTALKVDVGNGTIRIDLNFHRNCSLGVRDPGKRRIPRQRKNLWGDR